jgi:hypothetical protein
VARKIVTGPIKSVTRDEWIGYPVESRGDGIEIMSLSMFCYRHSTFEEARAFALAKAGKDDTHVQMEHKKRGIAPRCRKPDWHTVAEIREQIARVEAKAG